MSQKNTAVAEAYYKAMGEKDVEVMGQHLHPDIRFVGPMGDMTGKGAVLGATESLLPLLHNLKVRATFASETQAMVAYDLECLPPIGAFRVAALMDFEGDLISSIELFYDAPSFDQKKEDFLS